MAARALIIRQGRRRRRFPNGAQRLGQSIVRTAKSGGQHAWIALLQEPVRERQSDRKRQIARDDPATRHRGRQPWLSGLPTMAPSASPKPTRSTIRGLSERVGSFFSGFARTDHEHLIDCGRSDREGVEGRGSSWVLLALVEERGLCRGACASLAPPARYQPRTPEPQRNSRCLLQHVRALPAILREQGAVSLITMSCDKRLCTYRRWSGPRLLAPVRAFHLDAGLCDAPLTVQWITAVSPSISMLIAAAFQPQRVAKGNEFMGPLGAHDRRPRWPCRNTGPFPAKRRPLLRSAALKAGGKRTRASAGRRVALGRGRFPR